LVEFNQITTEYCPYGRVLARDRLILPLLRVAIPKSTEVFCYSSSLRTLLAIYAVNHYNDIVFSLLDVKIYI